MKTEKYQNVRTRKSEIFIITVLKNSIVFSMSCSENKCNTICNVVEIIIKKKRKKRKTGVQVPVNYKTSNERILLLKAKGTYVHYESKCIFFIFFSSIVRLGFFVYIIYILIYEASLPHSRRIIKRNIILKNRREQKK